MRCVLTDDTRLVHVELLEEVDIFRSSSSSSICRAIRPDDTRVPPREDHGMRLSCEIYDVHKSDDWLPQLFASVQYLFVETKSPLLLSTSSCFCRRWTCDRRWDFRKHIASTGGGGGRESTFTPAADPIGQHCEGSYAFHIQDL